MKDQANLGIEDEPINGLLTVCSLHQQMEHISADYKHTTFIIACGLRQS